MTPLDAVDPQLQPFFQESLTGPLSHETLPEARANMDAMIESFMGAPERAPEVAHAPNGDHQVELRIHHPAERRLPGLLYHMHGGGMVLGSAKGFDALAARLAESLGVPVVSVDYRLAPETAYPGPLEDCYAGLKWLAGAAKDLGSEAGRIVICGESAGGGLAAGLGLLARDRGEVSLAGQVLTYPMLDHRTGGPDDPYRNAHSGQVSWGHDSNQFGWSALRGDHPLEGADLGYYSPARAEDLSGLPPTWIGTGGLDLFVDENIDYARRLTAAGVACEFHLYPRAPHAFDSFPDAAVARQMVRDRMEAMAKLLA